MAKIKTKRAVKKSPKRTRTVTVEPATVDRGKVEELATEVSERLRRFSGAKALDPTIIAAIAAAIVQVIEALANCRQQTLSQAVRTMNFRARVRADRAIQEQLYHHRVHNVRSRDVLDLTREAMLARPAKWLDDMSTEVQQPDWGI